MQEIWKNVIGYDGLYQVSNFGNVKNAKGITKKASGKRYLKVILSKNGILKCIDVHRLVAQAFIPNPNNLPQVNHKDGNKLNNCVDNLEWCNAAYNIRHSFENNLVKNRKYRKVAKIKDEIILEIYINLNVASVSNNINCGHLYNAINGRCKTAKGYKWKYID